MGVSAFGEPMRVEAPAARTMQANAPLDDGRR
jgi:hypothetical protein